MLCLSSTFSSVPSVLFLVQYSVVRVETCALVRHYPRRQIPFDELVHTTLPAIHFLLIAVSSGILFQGCVCVSAAGVDIASTAAYDAG
jgi:hypothetical protein